MSEQKMTREQRRKQQEKRNNLKHQLNYGLKEYY